MERDARRADDDHVPQGDAARRASAAQVGRDGHRLRVAVVGPDAPAWVREIPAVALLRRVRVQNVGLVPADTGAGREDEVLVRWRTTAEGFAVRDFVLDCDREVAICPAGRASRSWTPDPNQGRAVVTIRFSTTDCRPCALKAPCTRSARRLLTPPGGARSTQLWKRRARAAEDAFALEYHRRAGIEEPRSAGVRALHLRRARYVGLAKTHLQHVLTAAAMNPVRRGAWLAGAPLARTRQSAFTRLMAQPAGA